MANIVEKFGAIVTIYGLRPGPQRGSGGSGFSTEKKMGLGRKVKKKMEVGEKQKKRKCRNPVALERNRDQNKLINYIIYIHILLFFQLLSF